MMSTLRLPPLSVEVPVGSTLLPSTLDGCIDFGYLGDVVLPDRTLIRFTIEQFDILDVGLPCEVLCSEYLQRLSINGHGVLGVTGMKIANAKFDTYCLVGTQFLDTQPLRFFVASIHLFDTKYVVAQVSQDESCDQETVEVLLASLDIVTEKQVQP